jgi:signal transduction histidine kinase
VIINLLTNAMDAMKDRPADSRRVFLSTRSDRDDGVAVTVIDSGPGLTTDQIETVFNPFYTTKTEGMGLGLLVCRSIIEAHGGHIRVENGPDGGAMPYRIQNKSCVFCAFLRLYQNSKSKLEFSPSTPLRAVSLSNGRFDTRNENLN